MHIPVLREEAGLPNAGEEHADSIQEGINPHRTYGHSFMEIYVHMDTAPDREAAADILLKYMILFFESIWTQDCRQAVGSGEWAGSRDVLCFTSLVYLHWRTGAP